MYMAYGSKPVSTITKHLAVVLSIWSNDHVFTSPHREISLHDHCDLEMHLCKTQHLHHCIRTLALCVICVSLQWYM